MAVRASQSISKKQKRIIKKSVISTDKMLNMAFYIPMKNIVLLVPLNLDRDQKKMQRFHYIRAAKAGHSNAIYRALGYYKEDDYPKIPEEIIQQIDSSPIEIKLYYAPRLCLFRDYFSKGFNFYQEAAKKGNPEALAWLGNLYTSGVIQHGIPVDYQKALLYMREAIKKGYPQDKLNIQVVQEHFQKKKEEEERIKNRFHGVSSTPLGDGYPGKLMPIP